MRITVMGSGGVGGYFGARLVRAGHDVTFVARGEHLREMQRSGLRIESAQDGNYSVEVNAVSDPIRSPRAELVLFCVKSYDTRESASLIAPVVDENTVLVSLQNGIDNEQILAEMLGQAELLGGVAYIFANIIRPGVIAHHQLGKIVIGNWKNTDSRSAENIAAALNGAGIPTKLDVDIRRTLWNKFVFLVALSGTTAVTRQPVGVIREIEETRALWQRQVEELMALARADGCEMGDGMLGRFEAMLGSLAEDNYSSLYHDLVNHKRLELEALHGHAIRLGATYSIDLPAITAVYAALKPYIEGAGNRS